MPMGRCRTVICLVVQSVSFISVLISTLAGWGSEMCVHFSRFYSSIE